MTGTHLSSDPERLRIHVEKGNEANGDAASWRIERLD
jgi:hypothetical protein